MHIRSITAFGLDYYCKYKGYCEMQRFVRGIGFELKIILRTNILWFISVGISKKKSDF